jgi:hypothetical protein
MGSWVRINPSLAALASYAQHFTVILTSTKARKQTLLFFCFLSPAPTPRSVSFQPEAARHSHTMEAQGHDTTFLVSSAFSVDSGIRPKSVFRNLSPGELYEMVRGVQRKVHLLLTEGSTCQRSFDRLGLLLLLLPIHLLLPEPNRRWCVLCWGPTAAAL